MGKYSEGQKWLRTRRIWLKKNPPNHEGYYECYICNKWVLEKEITLDHIIPRSRAPKLRYEFSNLRPCCYPCNSEKGSKVYDKIEE